MSDNIVRMTSRTHENELEQLISQFPDLAGRVTPRTTKAELIRLLGAKGIASEEPEEKVQFGARVPKSLLEEFRKFVRNSPLRMTDATEIALREFLENHRNDYR